MPAYFSITFELNKSSTAIGDFFDALGKSGLKFKSGFWGFENDTLEDITKWNQSKLDEDFKLGLTEHYSHNYKQALFDYSNFTEVRVFILNNAGESTFFFHLIIPEDDFVEFREENGQNIERRLQKRMDCLKQLAKNVWTYSSILTIQTAWECSSGTIKYDKIAPSYPPQVEPFSIIPQKKYHAQWDMQKSYIEPDGVFLEKEENWFYC